MSHATALPKLSSDVFVALAAIGWSDGELSREEADGILRAASECGYELAELERIEQATKQRTDFGAIDAGNLIGIDRAFIYATAIWLARLDGVIEAGEREALHALGDRLKLPDDVRSECSAAALEVAQAFGEGVAKYDFLALHKRLFERLSKRTA